jgi:hypothetical protein
MIHIATVHWRDESWIDVQLGYLRRNVTEPFQIYAWLNEVPGDHRHKFHYVNTEAVKQHAVKLNILANLICFDSNRADDLIMFLDGDAFPIGDIVPFVRQKLQQYPLVAVQRLENNGDIQPHPCFCVTTVGFWKRIGGDWKQGYAWKDRQGKPVTDVGGNLLGILRREEVDWYPMHRSNRVNLHPLWFGIYDGVIYHHGAAFRSPHSRIDFAIVAAEAKGTWRWPLVAIISRVTRRGRWFQLRRALTYRVVRQSRQLSTQMFENLRNDPEFYRQFT